MKNKSFVLSVLVNNNFGVLTRIAGLFARRGYNITSLTVGETLDKAVSRMTIECIGDDYTVNQIQCQLLKVEDVIKVELLGEDNSVRRELFLIKVFSGSSELIDNANVFDCSVLSADSSSTVFEVCGNDADFTKFCKMAEKYGKIDISRTGITAIST